MSIKSEFVGELQRQGGIPCELDPSALADEAIGVARERALDMYDFVDGVTDGARKAVDYYTEGCPEPTSLNGVDRVGRVVTAVLCSSPAIEDHALMRTESVAVQRDSFFYL